MNETHISADAKHIRRFLDCCEGNWHNCAYVSCTSCQTPAALRDFLYHPDENGQPLVLPLNDAALLFSRTPEPDECCSFLTLLQFAELYRPYLQAENLMDAPCLCRALLKHQEDSRYDW